LPRLWWVSWTAHTAESAAEALDVLRYINEHTRVVHVKITMLLSAIPDTIHAVLKSNVVLARIAAVTLQLHPEPPSIMVDMGASNMGRHTLQLLPEWFGSTFPNINSCTVRDKCGRTIKERVAFVRELAKQCPKVSSVTLG
jgi:hypothetical protein